jgi:glycosyltransferase involved in cell wall biosynthesis
MDDSGVVADRRLNIACVTSFDPRTPGKNSWSHTIFHMSAALQKRLADVTFLGPMDAIPERVAGKIVDLGYQLVSHQRYMYTHSEWVARRFGDVATRRLVRFAQPFDVVLSCGAVDVAYLRSAFPIVLVLDATHRLVRGYYPAYTNLCKRSQRELDTIERLAIQRAALVLVSSTWAARSVIADYHADPARVHAFPFGADLESPPPTSVLAARKRGNRCRLLFLGTDWKRKGGDLAVKALHGLEALGIDAELVVCGCAPPATARHPRLRVVPFLDKRDETQRQLLEALYLHSDFLLLPTRSDCAPMVFCEAAAFGLPVVTTDTGGVAEIVVNGVTGYTLPHAAMGDAYAEVIARSFRDGETYSKLVQASRRRYDERLNWDSWMQDAAHLIARAAREGQPRPRSNASGLGAAAIQQVVVK